MPGAMDAIAFSAFVGLLLVAGYATVMARVYELAAAIVADDMLTVRLFKIERMTPLSLNAVT